MVEFISYTGEYPNLCSGVLTVRIDGKEVRFGHDYNKFESWKTDGNYDAFWASGGETGFIGDYEDDYVMSDEWLLILEILPNEYKDYADELIDMFNENVPYGCCGGCL